MKRHVELRIDAIRFTHKERKRRVQCFDFVEVVQNESSNSCRGFSSVAAPFFHSRRVCGGDLQRGFSMSLRSTIYFFCKEKARYEYNDFRELPYGDLSDISLQQGLPTHFISSSWTCLATTPTKTLRGRVGGLGSE